jgi:hypothetical protein
MQAHVAKLKDVHWAYGSALLRDMRDDTEAELNCAWCRLPAHEKMTDKQSRIVIELIVRLLSIRKREAHI